MQRNPRSVIALILGCLLLVGCAAHEAAPHQEHDRVPPPVHTVFQPTHYP
jgi:uncharacterized protein YcfL